MKVVEKNNAQAIHPALVIVHFSLWKKFLFFSVLSVFCKLVMSLPNTPKLKCFKTAAIGKGDTSFLLTMISDRQDGKNLMEALNYYSEWPVSRTVGSVKLYITCYLNDLYIASSVAVWEEISDSSVRSVIAT